MIIAVNTRLNKETQPPGYEAFLLELLKQLTENYPQHQFIYISDALVSNTSFASNITPVVTGPKASNNLRLQYWLNYRVPAVLRKHKADVFVSFEGICSLKTKVPQCLLISDGRYLNSPQLLKKSQTGFYAKHTTLCIAKAKNIATVTDFLRLRVADKHKIQAKAITVINPAIDKTFKPLGWEEKELVKEKYAGEKAYFLYSGAINQNSNLINLLKAFTFFKTRQKSNMQLLLAGQADETFKKELRTYKLRNEVQLLEGLTKEELAKITASAYAFVYPVTYADIALPPLQAMHCAIPLICSNTGSLPTIFGEAALFTAPNNQQDIAEKMMLVFKDEDLAGNLVKKGNELLKQYQPAKTADLLMQWILNAVNS